jgi:Ser/Thr protein kinase RdoA (MazF antagonist)
MTAKKRTTLYAQTKDLTPDELKKAARILRASARQLEAWAELRKHKEA